MPGFSRYCKPRGKSVKFVANDIVEVREAAEDIEPLAIRYPDEGFHWKSAEFTGKE